MTLHFLILGYFNAIFYCSDIKTSEVKSISFLLVDSQLLLYLIEDLFDEVVSSCQVEGIYISKYQTMQLTILTIEGLFSIHNHMVSMTHPINLG